MVRARCQVVEDGRFVPTELGQGFGVRKLLRAHRQGSRLVEHDLAHRKGPIEQRGGAEEQPVSPGARLDDFVPERYGDSESAGARHDENRGGHAQGFGGCRPPDRQGARRQPEDGEDVAPRDEIPEPGVEGRTQGRREQRNEFGIAETGLGFSRHRAFGGEERSGRNGGSGLERLDVALAPNPVEAKVGPVGENRVDRHQISPGEEERVAGVQFAARNDRRATVVDPSREQAFGAVGGKELGTVSRDDSLLKPAAHQHQGDEHGDRVEELRPRIVAKEAPCGAGVGEDDAEGDRNVQVKDALSQARDRGP